MKQLGKYSAQAIEDLITESVEKPLEHRASELKCLNQTFKIGKTLKEYETEFARVGESFDFGDDYVGEVVCFCK